MNQTNTSGLSELTKFERAKRNADAIIKIGKGIRDDNFTVESFKNVKKSDSLENKKQWIQFSLKQKEMAKFNPYIKDNYEYMLAKDTYRTLMTNFYENPQLSQMTNSEFNDLVKNVRKDILSSFKELNVQPKNYAELLKQFELDIQEIFGNYMDEHNQYIYQNCLNFHGEDLAYQLDFSTKNLTNDSDIKSQMKKTVEAKVSECLDLGIPKDDIACNVLFDGFYLFASKYFDITDSEEILLLLKSSIKNLNASLISKDFDNDIQKMLVEAQKNYKANQLKISQDEMISHQNNKDLALTEFLNWLKSNEYASLDDIDNVLINLMDKYNVFDDELFNTILKSKVILNNKKGTDGFILSDLEYKSITGSLHLFDIESAVLNGAVSIYDAIRLSQNMHSNIKPEILEFEMSFDAQIFEKDKKLAHERNLIAIDLDRGRINLKEARKQIKEIIDK